MARNPTSKRDLGPLDDQVEHRPSELVRAQPELRRGRLERSAGRVGHREARFGNEHVGEQGHRTNTVRIASPATPILFRAKSLADDLSARTRRVRRTARPLAAWPGRSRASDPGVEHAQQQVRREVGEDHRHREQQEQSLQQRVIRAPVDGPEGELARAPATRTRSPP